MDEKYIVYVRADEAGRIVEINSSAFLADTAGWTAIDEGYGDKYHHAQGNYFPAAAVRAGWLRELQAGRRHARPTHRGGEGGRDRCAARAGADAA